MDAERFDALSRSLGGRTNRRTAVKRLGLLGAIAALFGNRASAQDDEAVTCVLAFHAETATGPSEDTTYDGVLTLIIEPEGEIDDAFLEMDDVDYDVVGQAIGRALSLRIELDDEQALSLHGIGARAIALCRGDIAGTFGGSEMRDIGTWMASSNRSESAITSSNSTTGSGTVVSGTSVSTSETGSDDNGSDACPDAQCTSPFVVDPQSCECVCPAALERCGDACCSGGSDCDDATGDCSCPSGSSPCLDICTPACVAGESLDPTTCQCTSASACPQPRTDCGGLCVDTMTDSGHCGECNFNCNLPKRCIAGVCLACIPKNSAGCTLNEHCCTGLCVQAFGGFCGECAAPGTICGLGVCADLTKDPQNCGLCGNDCGAGSECDGGNCVPTSVAPSG